MLNGTIFIHLSIQGSVVAGMGKIKSSWKEILAGSSPTVSKSYPEFKSLFQGQFLGRKYSRGGKRLKS